MRHDMIEDIKKKKQLEKIVKSAISVFSERGYKEAQMSHIAQEAGSRRYSIPLF